MRSRNSWQATRDVPTSLGWRTIFILDRYFFKSFSPKLVFFYFHLVECLLGIYRTCRMQYYFCVALACYFFRVEHVLNKVFSWHPQRTTYNLNFLINITTYQRELFQLILITNRTLALHACFPCRNEQGFVTKLLKPRLAKIWAKCYSNIYLFIYKPIKLYESNTFII